MLKLLKVSAIAIAFGMSQSASVAFAETNFASVNVNEKAEPSPQPTLLPIVRTKADLQRLSGQRVLVWGRYQRQPTPASTSPSGDPSEESLNPVIRPETGIPGFEPGKRPRGFANIVLEDGWAVPISPDNKISQRSPEELETYDNQFVEVVGFVHWWGDAGIVASSGIDIQQIRLRSLDSKDR
ncbi:MAG: hypothetical protein HC769_36665 [Cyanobacteria bacterium CRU_2_1]|nr:hypothetical protein [Cyanobacteria bacterium CRU_2_1]